MLTVEQAKRLSGHRRIVAETRMFEEPSRDDLSLRYAQGGLPFTSEHAAYLTMHLTSPSSLDLLALQKLVSNLHKDAEKEDFRWVVVVGVSFHQWKHWQEMKGTPPDQELFSGEDRLREILEGPKPPFALTGGELFFHIKAIETSKAEAVVNQVLEALAGTYDPKRTNYTMGDSLHGGRIYGGRMLHGLIGSVDPVCFSARAIIGDELPQHKGGCFGLTQRFVHDWQQLAGMADIDLENLIGRDHTGTIITNDDDRFHVKCVRVNNEDGVNYRLVGESQPYRSRSDRRYGKEDGIYQVSYAKSVTAFIKVLEGMLGERPGHIKSRHLNVSHADLGNYWYVPSAREMELHAPQPLLTVPMNDFFDVRSGNGRMFYNSRDYLHHLGNRTDMAKLLSPQPTDRVIELLGYTFSRWHDTWYRRRPTPELGHLKEYLDDAEQHVLELSVVERKGFASRRTLELLTREPLGQEFDTFRIHPKELIVGVVPEYTLGSGFEVMRYLKAEEQDEAFSLRLNEAGAAGHNVPNYQRLLGRGVGGLLADVKARLAGDDEPARQFYRAVVFSLEGVQAYLRSYGGLARKKLAGMRFGSAQDRNNLATIAQRMEKLATEPPETFLDAAQLVFSMHCCMHITGESVSLGRLDRLLGPFLDKDDISEENAQEIVDCFWIKMDEKVLLNHRHFHDRLSRGSGAITYEGGDFPQGAALNQWVHQVTVGPYMPEDGETPQTGSHRVMRMCLAAARRLPLNAPCLSVRVNAHTPDEILEEAACAILSGGAHPFLINDDKIVEGLMSSARQSGAQMDLADAREMVCDGCFEPLLAGRTEFAFSFVPVPDAIEMAMNRGRTYALAGPVHVTGLKASYRSERPEDIKTFEQFYEIFLRHYRHKLVAFYDGMLSRYGNLNRVCPSPLLSALIDGCLERGRDISAGGARYKFWAPLMNGISTAIDALWAIKEMVFTDEAVFTLPELVQCLVCDWGHDMKEPFCSGTMGADRIAVLAERFQKLRAYALRRPKFGEGQEDVDRFGHRLVRDLIEMAYDVFRNPTAALAKKHDALRRLYGTQKHPFEVVITPGIATFEDYAGIGSFLGASADGRRSLQAVASDFSPSPTPLDLSVPQRGRNAEKSLSSWAKGPPDDDSNPIDPIGIGLSNGSPVDINIREDFPETELAGLIRQFAQGRLGPNMMSITCADPCTLLKAQALPEVYDLVRMRMGGWSEFFVAMFPQHQEQHKRRPIFEAASQPAARRDGDWSYPAPEHGR